MSVYEEPLIIRVDVWIPVEDLLPEMQEHQHALSVLVTVYDHCSKKYSVQEAMFRKSNQQFEELVYSSEGAEFSPISDEVTHWMYLPSPAKI